MLLKLCQQIWLCLINRLFRWSLTHYKLPKGKHSASYLFSTLSSSLQIVMRLLLGGKVMTNLDSILKSRDITLLTKIHLVKVMVFPVVMYECESWTVKKAERPRIDAFELWCWRRLLRVPWTARRSNQSILKEISPQISLEGMILKLKLQYFGHLLRRVDSLEKSPNQGSNLCPLLWKHAVLTTGPPGKSTWWFLIEAIIIMVTELRFF